MFYHSPGNGLYPAHYLWPGMSYQSYHPSPIILPRHFQLYQISPLRQRQPYSSFTTYSGDLRTSRTWSNFHSGQNNFHSYPGPKYGESDTSDTTLRPSVIRYKILYKSKIKDRTISYLAFVGHIKKLFWFSLPELS